MGNRLTSAPNRAYAYNAANQLTNYKGKAYVHDANGNLTIKTDEDYDLDTEIEGWTYEYDFENRLMKVTKNEQNETKTVAFKYGPFGRRIEKRVESIDKGVAENRVYTYVYENEDIILEYLTASTGVNETSRYIHGPGIDEPVAMERGGNIYYYHADGLGSITAMTDGGGAVAQAYEYDSFGKLHDRMNAVKQPYTYTGREWDKDTGLYYYRARYYDQETGRFVSKDPIEFIGGINLYNYVAGNPINRVDPFGLKPGDKYPTQDEAATAALNDIINISISQDLEYAGWIYKINGGCVYSYTNPMKGTAHSSHPGPKPPNATAAYHTHGAESGPQWDDENFSKSDIDFARMRKVGIYLRTPSGKQLKYSP